MLIPKWFNTWLTPEEEAATIKDPNRRIFCKGIIGVTAMAAMPDLVKAFAPEVNPFIVEKTWRVVDQSKDMISGVYTISLDVSKAPKEWIDQMIVTRKACEMPGMAADGTIRIYDGPEHGKPYGWEEGWNGIDPEVAERVVKP